MFGHNVRRVFAAGLAVAVLGVAVPGVALAQAPNAAVLVAPASGATASAASPPLQVRRATRTASCRCRSHSRAARSGEPPCPGDGPVTIPIVVLPDTQNYTYAGPSGHHHAQTQWAVANSVGRSNIAFVVQLGDLVSEDDGRPNGPTPPPAFGVLDTAGIRTAWSPATMTSTTPPARSGCSTRYFPPDRYPAPLDARHRRVPAATSARTSSGPDPRSAGNMDNYSLFTAGGTDFLDAEPGMGGAAVRARLGRPGARRAPRRAVIMATHSFVSSP